jgi:hypothetical protein
MLADSLEHVHKVVIRIDVVQPTGSEQALHNADVLGALLGPAEQPVLFTHRDHPQGALEVVCVDSYLRVIQVNRQADPAFSYICQRTKEGTAGQEVAWRGRLLRHARRGNTIAAFCRDESVSTASFHTYHRLYR